MSRFISSAYEGLVPYTPGEQPKQGEKPIKLNTNENPYPPSPKVIEAIGKAELQDLNLYSDPAAAVLVSAIADNFGVSEENVMVGNGSDEILAFLFKIFRGKNGKIYYPEIGYSFYDVFCEVFQAQGITVPLRPDFSIDPRDYYDLDGTIVITNPNAPTGMALSRKDIEGILEHNKDNLVAVDEAYVDFGAESTVPLINSYDNLLVVQTFSKSRSLAGARIGFAVGGKDIIADMNRMKFSFNPYNVNRLSILAGAEAMKDKAYFDETRGKIMATRDKFADDMRGLGFEVLPSMTNFVFAKHGEISGEEYFLALKQRNIMVRHFKNEKIKDYVRITIGLPEEMSKLLDTTKEILKK